MKLPFFKAKKEKVEEKLAKKLGEGMTRVADVIAPGAIEVDFNHLRINDTFFRSFFVAGYPRFVSANWLAPLINFNHSLRVAMDIYPIEGRSVLDELRRKIGEMEAEIQTDVQRGRIINVKTQISLEDARKLQEQLAKGAERFFQLGLYITVSANSLKELEAVSKEVESTLGSLMIVTKSTSLQAEDGFKTTLPLCHDKLMITRNMDTTSLATTFPFTSSELTANEGVMYGINEHNDSLIIFDRFTLENANMVAFGKSGSGKSYSVKLELMRSLMFGTEVMAIDPENEYTLLSQTLGGEYINFSFGAETKINPFDLPKISQAGENVLTSKILSLHSLLRVMLGSLEAREDAVLDRALVATYKQKGITPSPQTFKNEPPLLEDLYKTLIGMEEAEAKTLASRLEKYVKGSFRGIFDQRTNVEITNPLTVFGIKDLSTELRPVAMFIILDFIWTKIATSLKKRLLVVDEAWHLMKHKDSAMFLYSIAKRARKYYLGLTTITQDVEDFLNSDYGKAIVTNSSLQLLMKQSPAAINKVAETFYLSEGEKNLLLAADVGEGLFFAGSSHVAIRVVGSEKEHRLATSKPEELLKMREEATAKTAKESKGREEEEMAGEIPIKILEDEPEENG